MAYCSSPRTFADPAADAEVLSAGAETVCSQEHKADSAADAEVFSAEKTACSFEHYFDQLFIDESYGNLTCFAEDEAGQPRSPTCSHAGDFDSSAESTEDGPPGCETEVEDSRRAEDEEGQPPVLSRSLADDWSRDKRWLLDGGEGEGLSAVDAVNVTALEAVCEVAQAVGAEEAAASETERKAALPMILEAQRKAKAQICADCKSVKAALEALADDQDQDKPVRMTGSWHLDRSAPQSHCCFPFLRLCQMPNLWNTLA